LTKLNAKGPNLGFKGNIVFALSNLQFASKAEIEKSFEVERLNTK